MSTIRLLIKKFFLSLIVIYQKCISPLFPSCCRFYPTCSNYAITAFKEYNILNALRLIFKRVIKCRPGGPYGYDPVPKP